MERKLGKEQTHLQSLKAELEPVLVFDDETKSRWYSGEFLVVREKDGRYEIRYGISRELCLEFDEELTVHKASIKWEEGDREYYAREFEPIKQWREDKWYTDWRRQKESGQKLLRMGDEHFAEYELRLDPDEVPDHVSKILHAVREEKMAREDESHYERSMGRMLVQAVGSEAVDE